MRSMCFPFVRMVVRLMTTEHVVLIMQSNNRIVLLSDVFLWPKLKKWITKSLKRTDEKNDWVWNYWWPFNEHPFAFLFILCCRQHNRYVYCMCERIFLITFFVFSRCMEWKSVLHFVHVSEAWIWRVQNP